MIQLDHKPVKMHKQTEQERKKALALIRKRLLQTMDLPQPLFAS